MKKSLDSLDGMDNSRPRRGNLTYNSMAVVEFVMKLVATCTDVKGYDTKLPLKVFGIEASRPQCVMGSLELTTSHDCRDME